MNKYKKILNELMKEGNGETFKIADDYFHKASGWKGKRSDLNEKEVRKAMCEDFKKVGIKNISVKDSYPGSWMCSSSTITVKAYDSDFINEELEKIKENYAKDYIKYYKVSYEEAKAKADNFYNAYEEDINHYYIDNYKAYTEEFRDKLKLIVYIANTYMYDASDSMTDYYNSHNDFRIVVKKV